MGRALFAVHANRSLASRVSNRMTLPARTVALRCLQFVLALLVSGAMWCVCADAAADGPESSVRILIGFREPVKGDAPHLISRLEKAAGAPIHYVASVSDKRHAYELACPARSSCAQAMRSLQQDPEVADVSSDAMRKPLPQVR